MYRSPTMDRKICMQSCHKYKQFGNIWYENMFLIFSHQASSFKYPIIFASLWGDICDRRSLIYSAPFTFGFGTLLTYFGPRQ